MLVICKLYKKQIEDAKYRKERKLLIVIQSKQVQILLSTYNGEKYLEELIVSLLDQDYTNFSILIRDDGSTDRTLEILKKYEKHDNISIIYGENIGVIKSFFELLKKSDSEAEYIAFCDQDDIWERNKVLSAVNMLTEFKNDIPLMYCSRLKIVNESLKLLEYSSIPKKGAKFQNSLVENIATGCTVIINKRTREQILKTLPQNIIMHDWWIYQVVSGIGKVIYDNESHILYRQHSTNVVGSEVNIFKKWKNRIIRFYKNGNKNLIRGQAIELKRIFGNDLSYENQQLLDSFINKPMRFLRRLRYAFSTKLYRQKKIDDLIFRILIAINKI